jgi:hypothetical protein
MNKPRRVTTGRPTKGLGMPMELLTDRGIDVHTGDLLSACIPLRTSIRVAPMRSTKTSAKRTWLELAAHPHCSVDEGRSS